ncbi:restriction endonuclease subunit S [Flavobacterium sp. ST-87]|uniref:Restriction endonuclease subunit S n=1 Tax=Flavobacterium plantiphilum TaxID=3163297 RepID=A0ABW8XRB5_9FLAO
MDKENKNPVIRFKGFTEDWIQQELGEFLTERKEMQKISEDAPILAFASGQGVIDRSERKSNNRDHLTLDQENKVYKLTEFNDIVYNPSNLKYGAIDRNKHGRGVISPIYVTFTTEEEPSFMELIVKSEKFKLRALQYEEGTVVKRQSVKPENLLSLKVELSSSLDEQKQIGAYFQNLDNLIALQQKKHDQLIILKKAMLVKMFPKKGALVPEIRFKGFTEDWEEDTLGKIARITTGKSNREDSDLEGEYTFFDRSEEIRRSDIYLFDCEAIIIAGEGSDFTPKYFNGKFDLHQRTYAIMNSKDIDGRFLQYQIHLFRKYFLDQAVGSTVKSLRLPMFLNMSIKFPSKIEQQKIGSYFQNLDNQIALHKTQLDKLNNIKKACFTKMFVAQD